MDADVIIIGGGLNGCVLALALHQSGQRVLVLDAASPAPRGQRAFDGRSVAIMAPNARMLQALDVWPALASKAQPITHIKLAQGTIAMGCDPFFLHLDHAQMDAQPSGYMIENRHVRDVLMKQIKALKIPYFSDAAVVDHSVKTDHVQVQTAAGKHFTARLLACCDGRGSPSAARAGLSHFERPYGQSALTCTLSHSAAHNGVAHQYFLPSGPLAILPLKGQRSSIVWTDKSSAAASIHSLNDADFLSVLHQRIGNVLGDIALACPRACFPLSLSLAYHMIAPRLALVGDAAHSIHPIAGQGLNMGLKDAAALAQVVSQAAQRGQDVGDTAVLTDYQNWRRFDIARMALATDGANGLFSNDAPFLQGLRGLGMQMINGFSPLKSYFMRAAIGNEGNLPLLQQGRRLLHDSAHNAFSVP